LNESLVWTIGGEKAREDYKGRQSAETSTLSGIAGSGYDWCSRNRDTALSCVREVHDEAVTALKRFDTVSRLVRTVADTMMPRPHRQGRLQAIGDWQPYGILFNEQRLTLETPPQSPASPGVLWPVVGTLGPSTSAAPNAIDITSPDHMSFAFPPPRPRDYFDVIGGTSTGRHITVRLGCLRMAIYECIAAHTPLADRMFEKKSHRANTKGKPQARFDAAELERAIKQILRDGGLGEDALLLKDVGAPCRV